MWKVEDSAAFDRGLAGDLEETNINWWPGGRRGLEEGWRCPAAAGAPGARSQVKASQDLRNKQTCAQGPAAC